MKPMAEEDFGHRMDPMHRLHGRTMSSMTSAMLTDDIDSRSWCIQIVNNQPKLVWESKEFVPYTECEKSNIIVQDGKVYGSDATESGTNLARRPKRGCNSINGRISPAGTNAIKVSGNSNAGM